MAAPRQGIFQRLRKLFSTQVVVRKVGKDRIKVVDPSRLQSSGNKEQSTSLGTKFSGIYSQTGYRQGDWENHMNIRHRLYQDYEAMDTDSIIASILDVMSDECLVSNDYGEALTIKSDNENVKEVLENLFYDVLNIEFNLWSWIRTMNKYGDCFLQLIVDDELGVVNVIPLSPYELVREEGFNENNPFEVRFRIEQGQGTSYHTLYSAETQYLDYYEVAHFRLITDPNYLPYGRSILEPARKVWKQLILMEDAMMINRIMKAPERRIFKIDVGSIPLNQVDAHMNELISKMKKVPYIDETSGEYNLKFNLMNMLEDYYLPVRGGESGTEIDTLQGMEWNGIDDIEYLKNRMLAALKVPKSFINYSEDIEGKATLAQQDIRFARTIERIQKIVVSELTKIAIIHLYVQGYTGDDLIDFTLELTSPSIIFRQERLDLFSNQTSLLRDMKDLNMVSSEWMYKNILNMSDREIAEQKAKVLDDLKETFRHEQIKMEGNDPAQTQEALGTQQALAGEDGGGFELAMFGGDQESEDEKQQDGEAPTQPKTEGEMGRPPESGNYKKAESTFGVDPLGMKSTKRKRRGSLIKHDYKNGPLGMELKRLKKFQDKYKLLNENNRKSILDEDNLFDDI